MLIVSKIQRLLYYSIQDTALALVAARLSHFNTINFNATNVVPSSSHFVRLCRFVSTRSMYVIILNENSADITIVQC